jgi:hypothetical protein
LLSACVFVTRDTVRHPRRFLFGNRFVRDERCSWTEIPLYIEHFRTHDSGWSSTLNAR